jgi:hypothetical protein
VRGGLSDEPTDAVRVRQDVDFVGTGRLALRWLGWGTPLLSFDVPSCHNLAGAP